MFIGLLLLFIFSFCCCTFSYSGKINTGFKNMGNILIIFFVRLMMLINGLFWINYKYITPKPYNLEYFETLGELPYASIITNHTTWQDIFFFLAMPKAVGFISNKGVIKYPIVGIIAQMIQCIFVDRSSPESKAKCFDDLKQRAKNIKKDKKGKTLFDN